jgi:acyl-coenzyme A thioesterase PaaI-like protein
MTSSARDNPSARLQKLWRHLQPLPGGCWLFSRILGWLIPYTGTIGANVKQLRPGYAQIQLREHRRIRNHLRSVHALALANLGELTSGMAMFASLPVDVRGIPTKLTIEYYKKARGMLTAESYVTPPSVSVDTDFEIFAEICDADGDVVARTTAIWRLSPVPPQI